MTPKQILDSFSETLMRDDRILSAPERALLNAVLQHAKTSSGQSPETQQAVRAVIASAVGETVAQRAFCILGASIVERILENYPLSTTEDGTFRAGEISSTEPQPPSKPKPSPPVPPAPEPQPPHAAPRKAPLYDSPVEPQPPHKPMRSPSVPPPPSTEPQPPHGQPQPPHEEPQPPHGEPQPPHGEPQPPHKKPHRPVRETPTEPQPPHGVRTTLVSEARLAVTQRPAILPARSVVLDEFLAPQELEAITQFTLEHEADFQASEVVSPIEENGVVNYEHRRSRVLTDLGPHQGVILERIKNVLPHILRRLGMEEFVIADVEAQVTSSNDGDFFHFHSDSGSERVASRYLTFVYFFHREPCQFEGGELRIHDARLEDDRYVSEGTYQTIVPQQNQIVFFPCELLHEITPVKCPSRHFADSRFTMNGWLRR